MVIQHNIGAMQAQRYGKVNTQRKAKASEKLSSGYRINRAADDAASLAISEKLRSQIRGLNQGTSNLQDGISLTQVADGALVETQEILQRINELSVKSANGTNTVAEREKIQSEVEQLTYELNKIAYSTSFNDHIYPLRGGVSTTKFEPAPGTVNKLAGASISNGFTGPNNTDGNGSLYLTALAGAITSGAGGLGVGSAGAMVKVYDQSGKEVKVMLHRDEFTSGGKLNITTSGDIVTFHYDDPTTGIKFEVEQSFSTYDEIDETTQTGYSFYDIKYKFTNLSGKNLTYDIATAFDNFGGRYNAVNPYYVNGTPHSTQMRDPASGGGNYQIETPPIPGLSVHCELVTRISGDGLLDDADEFLMLGDTNSQADRDQIWRDLYSGRQTSGGSGALADCDEIYGLWLNKNVSSNASYTTNVLQGIKYKVVPVAGTNTQTPKDVWIQAGNQQDNGMYLDMVDATAKNLKVDTIDVSTQKGALAAIDTVKNALQMCSEFRGQFGAYANRMESSMMNNQNISENTQAAESLMRDTDMAKTMVQYSLSDLVQQTSHSMLAQANQNPKMVLSLLT